ncbi:MAG: hypothetical protein HYV63_14630 [Candidatus Schekmanbacteria bacterium]|nr:hypothetical protein [Candidatus Schekmanbacteria bacterium]
MARTTLGVLKAYYAYSRQRFPLSGALLYAGSLFSAAYCFAGLLGQSEPAAVAPWLLGVFVSFASLLRLRIVDEHKDSAKDRLAYPDRLLSRGEVTLSGLRRIYAACIVAEAAISASRGTAVLAAWLVLLGYSLLMSAEFFAPRVLNRSMGLYLVTHQLLVPVTALYGVVFRGGAWDRATSEPAMLALFLFTAICSTITYEIARKTWHPEREREGADSYTKSWGHGATVAANAAFAAGALAGFGALFSRYAAHPAHPTVALALFLGVAITAIRFYRQPTAARSSAVAGAGAAFLVGQLANAAIAFALSSAAAG